MCTLGKEEGEGRRTCHPLSNKPPPQQTSRHTHPFTSSELTFTVHQTAVGSQANELPHNWEEAVASCNVQRSLVVLILLVHSRGSTAVKEKEGASLMALDGGKEEVIEGNIHKQCV